MNGSAEVALGARVGAAPRDWREAVRVACSPLVDAGAVEPRYVDRCLAMVEEHGPYMVVAPGIALAHARPEDGVVALGLSVAVLSVPVDFGHEDNDPVGLVFAFGSPDKDQHVGLLSALARQLVAGLGDRLHEADDDDAASALLEKVLDELE
jgi:ascorbate PTS system EIIA or EIIAB component